MSDDKGLENYWRCGCGELNNPARLECGNCGSHESVRTDPILGKPQQPQPETFTPLTMESRKWENIVEDIANPGATNAVLVAECRAQAAEVQRLTKAIALVREWALSNNVAGFDRNWRASEVVAHLDAAMRQRQ